MFSISALHGRGWRIRVAALFAAFALIVGLSGGNTEPARAASPVGVSAELPARASVPAPSWLVKFVAGKARGGAASIMESLGFKCASTPFVCWHETNYDPPRWFYYGKVDTGNGPGGYMNARGWADTSAPRIRTFPESWKLVIFCQTHGRWVYGRWGWTDVWDYVGHDGDAPMLVSDGFVYTGSNNLVSGDCGATNMGDNP